MKKVVIMRGPSGSGKSTYIKENHSDATVVSADHYFIRTNRETGEEEYVFNPMKLSVAHSTCLRKFIEALQTDSKTVVVDNTNIHLWEFENYIAIAKALNWDIDIVEFRPTTIQGLRDCIKRNSHGTPADAVARMFIEFETYEGKDAKVMSSHPL
jgi:predicted kinase